MSDMTDNTEERIRVRAYHLWLADGCPKGREEEYWERARELEAIAENPTAGQLPNPMTHPPLGTPIEEAELMENLGEFPVGHTDQGERLATPVTKEEAHRLREEA